MKNFKIVADSSADVTEIAGVDFSSVPLKIITSEREFIDNETLNVEEMVTYLAGYKGRSSSSCPSPQDWISAFGEAEEIFCITITSALSGCNNSALIAKKIYEEKYPERSVFVFDSLSTGPEMKLIMEKVAKDRAEGKTFDEICKSAEEYSKTTGLFFLLQSMKNLVNNGRISSIVAKAAGLLGIRILGKASDKGELALLDKCRGEENALKVMLWRIKEAGHVKGKVKIAHCLNEKLANTFKQMILKDAPDTEIEIYETRALCSFYAESGGLLVGIEKK